MGGRLSSNALHLARQGLYLKKYAPFFCLDRLFSSKTSIITKKLFFIKFKYDSDKVVFIKTLAGAYWSEKYRNWVVRATADNLEKLQTRFECWSEQQLGNLREVLQLQENPLVLELYVSPEFPRYFQIKLSGRGADFDYLRKLASREYDREARLWRAPLRDEVVDRLIDHYKNLGAKIINRIPDGDENRYLKSRLRPRDWRSGFLTRLPPKRRQVMEEYINTLMRQHYSIKTIRSYSTVLLRYLIYLGERPLGGC